TCGFSSPVEAGLEFVFVESAEEVIRSRATSPRAAVDRRGFASGRGAAGVGCGLGPESAAPISRLCGERPLKTLPARCWLGMTGAAAGEAELTSGGGASEATRGESSVELSPRSDEKRSVERSPPEVSRGVCLLAGRCVVDREAFGVFDATE